MWGSKVMGLNCEHFCAPGTFGSTWRHFWLSRRKNATGIQWVEARDAAKYPTMHRTAVQNKELSSQSVNSAKVEKPSKR